MHMFGDVSELIKQTHMPRQTITDMSAETIQSQTPAQEQEATEMLSVAEQSETRTSDAADTSAAVEQSKSAEPPSTYLRWITATVGHSLRLISVDEIMFFQSDQKYTRVVLAESEVLIKKSLKELISELDPAQFWKRHRSIVVNALEVASIDPSMTGELTVKLKRRRELLPVSEAFVRKLRQM